MITELLLSFISIIAIAFVAHYRPTEFFLFCIFILSGFLGVIPYEVLKPLTPENILFFVSISIFVEVIISILFTAKIKKMNKLNMFPFLMAMLFIYGVAKPIVDGNSGLQLAITDGKQVVSYTILLFVLIKYKQINKLIVEKSVVFIGLLLSIYVVAAASFKIYPPGYLPVNPNGAISFSENIHIKYPMFILFAYFLLIDNTVIRNPYLRSTMRFLLFMGVILQSHMSITLLFLIIFCVAWLYKRVEITKTLKVSIAASAILIFSGYALISNKNVFENIVSESSSIASRFLINQYRFDYIYQEPILGYGFIHEDSSLGAIFNGSSIGLHDKRLATIDAGYIDILVRFGLLGLISIAFLYLLYVSRLNKLAVDLKGKVFIYFLYGMIPVSLTWSILTYNHGIISIACATLFILGGANEKESGNNNQYAYTV